MYTKIEFHLYSNYDTTKTVQELSLTASKVYTDLYKCSLSPTKTLGLSDYFGNEPQVFNFELEYDDWLRDNILDESKDLSREFSSYVIRVFRNDVYIYSGVLMLEYFQVDLARLKIKLKSYNWLIFLNRIKDTFIWFPDYSTTISISYPPAVARMQYPLQPNTNTDGLTITGETRQLYTYPATNAGNFAGSIIRAAQSLVFEDAWSSDNPTIKAFVDIENILFERENIGILNLAIQFNKQYTINVSHEEGFIYNQTTDIVYYFHCRMRTRSGSAGRWWRIEYRHWGFNGINQYANYEFNTEYRDDDSFLQERINQVNDIHKIYTGTTENLLRRDGSQPKPNTRTGFDSVTDNDGNIYTRSYSLTNRSGDQNVYWDIVCYCDYLTNGASVLWKQSDQSQAERLSTSDCLKTVCIAANACFVITPDDPDEIKFITKYKDSSKFPIAISDDDIIDDCELLRIAKTDFDSSVLKNTIGVSQAARYTDKLTVYYNQFFEQNNSKISFTVSKIFNTYNFEITDKIDILNYAQVINSIDDNDEHFTEIESMNYMIDNWIDELGNYIIDESGNRISFRSF